jgi:ribosome maturation protein Sdo1
MLTAKQEVLDLIEQLPNDVSMDEIIYHVYVFSKVKKGQKAVKQGATLTSEELKGEIDSWF